MLWTDSVRLGELVVKNRIVMAAMTRCRCPQPDGVITPLHVDYYSQRAGAGLLLTEALAWSPRGRGFLHGAELFNENHLAHWPQVIKAVHAKQSRIIAQLVHAGRVTHSLKNGGLQILAPSPIRVRNDWNRDLNMAEYAVPKEMTISDIKETKKEFETSVMLAKRAGFDGVQLHGGHGFLIDCFLRSGTNLRTDEYGGSVQGRCRFALELVDIARQHFQIVGIKVSPVSRANDTFDENPLQTFTYLFKELTRRQVAFVEVRESTEKGIVPSLFEVPPKAQIEDVCAALRPHFDKLIIANNGFTGKSGLEKIRSGNCDAISFGKFYIANPDLAERIIQERPVNRNWSYDIYYDWTLGKAGYTDFPTYEQEQSKSI